MPSPSNRRHIDQPLEDAIKNATHVRIKCRPPTFVPNCGHEAIWLMSDLVAKMPRCRTLGEFQSGLRCSRCKRRGWVEIMAAGR
jgi:hypothetical protein